LRKGQVIRIADFTSVSRRRLVTLAEDDKWLMGACRFSENRGRISKIGVHDHAAQARRVSEGVR
jgi:hypothetical protein